MATLTGEDLKSTKECDGNIFFYCVGVVENMDQAKQLANLQDILVTYDGFILILRLLTNLKVSRNRRT